jgi:hypothetical protein
MDLLDAFSSQTGESLVQGKVKSVASGKVTVTLRQGGDVVVPYVGAAPTVGKLCLLIRFRQTWVCLGSFA